MKEKTRETVFFISGGIVVVAWFAGMFFLMDDNVIGAWVSAVIFALAGVPMLVCVIDGSISELRRGKK